MARPLPAKIKESPQGPSEIEMAIVDLMADGMRHTQIAKKLAPDDKKKQKAIRAKIRRMAQGEAFQLDVARQARALKVLGLLPSTEALVRKAAAGRVDAIKLLFESSGYYSPKSEVNHSGEVQITIKGLPRPERVEDETIADAEVID
jgi:hypothetical protein